MLTRMGATTGLLGLLLLWSALSLLVRTRLMFAAPARKRLAPSCSTTASSGRTFRCQFLRAVPKLITVVSNRRFEPTGPAIAEFLAPSDGPMEVGVRGNDAAGNTGVLSASYAYTVDTLPPTTEAWLPWWSPDSRAEGGSSATPSTSSRIVAVNASAFEGDGSDCPMCAFRCWLEAQSPTEALSRHEVNCTSTTSNTANATFDFALSIDGLYTLRVAAEDGAGNLADPPKVLRWLADVTPPNTTAAVIDMHATALPSMLGGGHIVNSSEVLLGATCTDDWPLCVFHVYLGDMNEPEWPHVEASGESTLFTVPLNSTAGPDSEFNMTHLRIRQLPDGNHTLTVASADLAGNLDNVAARVRLVVDTTDPEARIIDGPSAFHNASSAIVEIEASELVTTALVQVWASPDGVASATDRGLVAATRRELGSIHTAIQLDGLPDGWITLKVWSVDLAGNSGRDTAAQTAAFVVDTTPPDLVVLSSAPAVTNQTEVVIVVACASEPSMCNYTMVDAAGAPSSVLNALPAGATLLFDSFPESGSIRHQAYTTSANLTAFGKGGGVVHDLAAEALHVTTPSDGQYAVVVKTTDASGNVAPQLLPISWAVDTVPPVSVGSTPSDRFGLPDVSSSKSLLVDAQCSAAEASPPCSFALVVDGVTVVTATTHGRLSTPPLPAGNHSVSLVATDNAGNTEVNPFLVAVAVDPLAPVVSLLAHPTPVSSVTRPEFEVKCTDHTPCDVYFRSLGGLDACSVLDISVNTSVGVDVASGLWSSAALRSHRAGIPAADEDAGVDALEWVLREWTFSLNFDTPFADGDATVILQSMDAGGLVGSPVVFSWIVDTVPPETPRWVSTPPVSTSETTVQFQFELLGEAGGAAIARTFPFDYSLARNGKAVATWEEITTDLDTNPRLLVLRDLDVRARSIALLLVLCTFCVLLPSNVLCCCATLQEGRYQVKLRARDLANNTSPAATSVPCLLPFRQARCHC